MMGKCTKESIDHCSFEYWYPLFSSSSINARFIPLSLDFIEYLNSDGLVLPIDPNDDIMHHNSDDALSDYSHSDSEEAEPPSFPSLCFQINQTITDLGGAVFPKLNWSSPKDATWISLDSSLKCTNINDIFLLLKSSDFISHDLNHPYENVIDAASCKVDQYFLVLKKWCNLFPSMEFRVFVKDKTIVGICQRDICNYYDFLSDLKEEFRKRIIDFFDLQIRDTFPESNCNFYILLIDRCFRFIYQQRK